MGYLTRGAGLSNTSGLTLSVWFYVFPQGAPSTLRTFFRCGADIGAVDGQPFSGTTIGCFVAGSGDFVFLDVRNCPECPEQLAASAFTTGGGSMTRGGWNHIVASFQRLGLNSIKGQLCLNGVIRNPTTTSVADITAIPLNDGFIGVPVDSVFAQNITESPLLPLAQYQMWMHQNIAMTDQNMANFFTITNGVGMPRDYLVAEVAFGTPELSFIGNPTQFPQNRGSLGNTFSQVGTTNNFSPLPSFG